MYPNTLPPSVIKSNLMYEYFDSNNVLNCNLYFSNISDINSTEINISENFIN